MMNSTMALLIAVLLCVLSVQGFAPLSSSNSRLLFIERYATSSSTIPFYAKEVSSATSSGSSSTKDKAVVVAGGTGYIGKAVVAESVKLGYKTFVLVRNVTKLSTPEGQYAYGDLFNGATVVECNVEDPSSLKTVFESIDVPVDAVVSCLASPSGTKKSAYAIDYQATLNCLEAGQNCDARHFVMLSAFCCRRPLLQLQQAKLAFEAELAKQDKMTWSVVRPTAFFKSISGQLEAIKSGAPYVLFDDGAVTQCNAIAECELAEFMLDSLVNEEKKNKIMNVGGPDEPLTNKMLGEMMFKAIGKEPKYVYAPTWIFDSVLSIMLFFASLFPSGAMDDAVETGRIGKYYAVEDMLTTEPTEKYGKITTQQHYNKIASMGQDPFTPVRATAVIGRVLESLPVFALTIPALAVVANNPGVVMTTVESEMRSGDFSMMLASLGIH